MFFFLSKVSAFFAHGDNNNAPRARYTTLISSIYLITFNVLCWQANGGNRKWNERKKVCARERQSEKRKHSRWQAYEALMVLVVYICVCVYFQVFPTIMAKSKVMTFHMLTYLWMEFAISLLYFHSHYMSDASECQCFAEDIQHKALFGKTSKPKPKLPKLDNRQTKTQPLRFSPWYSFRYWHITIGRNLSFSRKSGRDWIVNSDMPSMINSSILKLLWLQLPSYVCSFRFLLISFHQTDNLRHKANLLRRSSHIAPTL